MPPMDAFLGALLIFCLRILDVSIGTLRVMYMVRGDRRRAVPLAFVESGIWIIAISKVMAEMKDGNWPNMAAFAAGFAAGTMVGMTLERWIASGWIMVRIISRSGTGALVQAIRAKDFGVTVLEGEGREGEQSILFIVAPRRRGTELLRLVRELDERAFITGENGNTALGGYLPQTAAAGLRK